MDYASLRSALAEHFGPDSEICSPEHESDAWRAISDSCRDGEYPGLYSEVTRLISRDDDEIVEFLRSCAPAWDFEDAAGARRSLEVFHAYIDAYAQ